MAASGARLLARLRAVDAAAQFQAAGEALARAHAGGAAPDTQAAQVTPALIFGVPPSASLPALLQSFCPRATGARGDMRC